jgi:ABC-type transport system involved in cytochrome c biogenesis permease component
MATSVEIDTEGSGTSPFIYLLIVVLILGIAVGPPIVAGRLRPSVKQ